MRRIHESHSQVDYGIYERNLRTGRSSQGFINLNIFRGKLKDRFDECAQTHNLNNTNKQQSHGVFKHTVTFSFTAISAANQRKVFSKVILRRAATAAKPQRRKTGWYVLQLFTWFTGSRVTRRQVPPRPRRHRIDSDM